jgi:hypothetical protein
MGALIALGCARSGDVVVVIDSTMRGESVEVVALPADPLQQASANAAPARDSLARLRRLDDSAMALDARFRALRDTLSGEVRALDSTDRRTRRYAVRYAEIRRRTLGAEALRSDRDSVRRRADMLRSRLGARAATAAATPSAEDDAASASGGGRRAERRPIRDGALTLSLAPGRWWIGAARSGAQPTHYDSVTVRHAATDTVYLGLRRAGRLPGVP